MIILPRQRLFKQFVSLPYTLQVVYAFNAAVTLEDEHFQSNYPNCGNTDGYPVYDDSKPPQEVAGTTKSPPYEDIGLGSVKYSILSWCLQVFIAFKHIL